MTNFPMEFFRCTKCGAKLGVETGGLSCTKCHSLFEVLDGIPIFLPIDVYRKWDSYSSDVYHQIPVPDSHYLRMLGSSKRILDVASGTGNWSSRALGTADITFCVDSSLRSLRIARPGSAGRVCC